MTALIALIAVIGAGLSIGFTPNQASAQDVGKICMSTDVGGRGDLSFNDMAFQGVEQAESEFGLEKQVAQPSSESDYLPTLRQFARSGECGIIIAVGSLLGDAVNQAAQEFPDQNFALIDGVVDQPNVLSLVFKEQEVSAVVGALGAMIAAEFGFDRVGIVLGIEIPVLWRFEAGYRFGIAQGEQMYESVTGEKVDIGLSQQYTGTFSDVAAGKSAAQSQLAQGAATVFNVAGPLGTGILEAVKEKLDQEGKSAGPPFMIGVDANQDWLGNGNKVVASAMKRVDTAAFTAVQRVVNGNFKGETITFGLADGGVGMSRFADLQEFIQFGLDSGEITEDQVPTIRQNWLEMRESIPHYIWDSVNHLENQIVEGEVTPPSPQNESDIEEVREQYP
ncbi:MAG: BMP family protein [Candidatus Bipolaricaulia bacterium]